MEKRNNLDSSAPKATAAVGYSLVKAEPDPCEDYGVRLVASKSLQAGQTVLVEDPLLVVLPPSPQYLARLKMLASHLEAKTEEEKRIAAALMLQKAGFIRACAEASVSAREKILGLQTEFADASSTLAGSVEQLAVQLHEAELYRGCGKNPEDLFAGGAALSQQDIRDALTCSVVNSFDFMPEGSDALFYQGSLFQHSCEPNAKMHVVRDLDSGRKPAARSGAKSKGDLPTTKWLGEWRTIRSVAKGDSITVSYLEESWLVAGLQERRQKLMAKMAFLCGCCRCKRESGQPVVALPVESERCSWADSSLQRLFQAISIHEGSRC